MGKAEENKLKKRESLLNTAFELFTTKGIHDTSISDIVEKAGVAKGTFYLTIIMQKQCEKTKKWLSNPPTIRFSQDPAPNLRHPVSI